MHRTKGGRRVEPIVSARPEHVDIRYQDEARGLAHAIASAREEEDSLILLPDTVFLEPSRSNQADSRQSCPTPDAAVLAQKVSVDEVRYYGIAELESAESPKSWRNLIPPKHPAALAVAARYFLSDRMLRLS